MGCLAGKQARQLLPLHSPVPLPARDTGQADPWDGEDRNLPCTGKGERGRRHPRVFLRGRPRGPGPLPRRPARANPASPMLLPAASLGRGGTGSHIPGPPSPPRGQARVVQRLPPTPGPCRPPAAAAAALPVLPPGSPRCRGTSPAKGALGAAKPKPAHQPRIRRNNYRLPLVPAFALHSVVQSPAKGIANKSYVERSDAAIQRPSASL